MLITAEVESHKARADEAERKLSEYSDKASIAEKTIKELHQKLVALTASKSSTTTSDVSNVDNLSVSSTEAQEYIISLKVFHLLWIFSGVLQCSKSLFLLGEHNRNRARKG